VVDANVGEIWKPVLVSGYEGHYEVSNFGNVRRMRCCPECSKSLGAWRTLHITANRGYKSVALCVNSTKKTVPVHRLVAIAFLGEPTDGRIYVNHKNCDGTDNRLENLEWCTKSENALHAINNGRWNNTRGENSARTKLKWEQVNEMRERRKSGESISSLSRFYGVSHTCVSHICKNLRWIV